MWKVVEIKAEESRVAETERRRDQRESRKKARRKGKGERENNRCEKGSRGVGNLG